MSAPANVFGFNIVQGINAQTGTTYTFVASDAAKLVTLSNASAIAVTVPQNSSIPYPIGTKIECQQLGVGAVTFGGSGITFQSPGGLTTSAQYSRIILEKVATDTWLVDIRAASNVIAKAVAVNDIVSNAAKTAAFSFTVPAAKLGTDKIIKIELWGDYLNNSGSTRVLTLEIAYGATVMWADASTAQTASATRHAWRWEIYLQAQNSASAQAIGGCFQMSNITGATTGIGDLSVSLPTNATVMNVAFSGTAAETSTGALTFAANVTHPASDANLSFKVRGAIAYMVGEGQKGDRGNDGVAGQLAGVVDYTADHTLATGDRGYDVRMTKATTVLVNIDTEANSGIATGFYCLFSQGGAGTVTATALSGVTLRAANGASTLAQYDARGLEYLGSNEWRVW
jgi:hypothetical protein